MTSRTKTFPVELKKLLILLGAAGLLAGCNLAPRYQKPSVETPAAFKENAVDTNIWKTAQPNDAAIRGKWWEMFGDTNLNALEEQVTVSNQTVAAAFYNFLAARSLVKESRAQYFPTLVTSPDVTRSRQSQTLGHQNNFSSQANPNNNNFSLPLDASWQPDLWGRVRNTVKANAAAAQASAADLENTRLTAQGELASDYFQLRSQDSLKHLFDDTVKAYNESYELEKVLFKTGIASDQDVAQAETQLETAQAQDTNLGILRAQLEHAIAMLTGRAASAFSLPVGPLTITPPAIPVSLPSKLLERRPDIAAAERAVAENNSQIGVARAAYFPNVTLTASGGFESSAFDTLFNWPSRVWSLGAGATETIFDAGERGAVVAQYRALRDAAAAQYRQTALVAFQEVEDDLASLRLLDTEIKQQDIAVKSSAHYLDLAKERYRLGIDSYLNVITAQTTLLSNSQTLQNLRSQQMTAAVQLIEALGGGWDSSQLPSHL